MARIFIVGSGVVGSATGRGFANAGHDVTFIDIAESRLAALTAEGHDARRFLNLDAEDPSYIFLTLPTPNSGHSYDLGAFERGVRDVGRALATAANPHTVVVRSTVPPGTSTTLVTPALEVESGKREGAGFAVAANPEFLRAASADDDFRWPWMTIVGARSKRVAERLSEMLVPFGGELRVFDNPETAEMIKCAHNLYNAAKISFWNEMWMVCRALGVDHDQVAATVANSAEGSYNRNYGIRGGAPYGGVCLPKDTQGFLGFARKIDVPMPLLEAVVEVNDRIGSVVASEFEWAEQNAQVPMGVIAQAVADARPALVDLAAAEAGTASPVASRTR